MASYEVLNLDFEFYRSYQISRFSYYDFLNKPMDYSDFIYFAAYYPITDWDEDFLLNMNRCPLWWVHSHSNEVYGCCPLWLVHSP